jgi:hypothetical protein
MFIYDSADMKFHNYVNKDLCISFNNPNRDGEQMRLARCQCGGNKSIQQELLVKYFTYNKSNGFKPWSVFTLTSRADSRMALKVSQDGSLLLPSQRYAKIAYGAKSTDAEKFYWDPNHKCLKNFQYNDGCLGSVQ